MGGENEFSSHVEINVGVTAYFFFFLAAAFFLGAAFFAGFFFVGIDLPPFRSAVADG
jgi:hypothetical protein